MNSFSEDMETKVRSSKRVHFKEGDERPTERNAKLSKAASAFSLKTQQSTNTPKPKKISPPKSNEKGSSERKSVTRTYNRADYLENENQRLKRDLSANKEYITKMERFLSKSMQGDKDINVIQELSDQKRELTLRVNDLQTKLQEHKELLAKSSRDLKTLQESAERRNAIFKNQIIDVQELNDFLIEYYNVKDELKKLNEREQQRTKELTELTSHKLFGFSVITSFRIALEQQIEEMKFIQDAHLKELEDQERSIHEQSKEIEKLNQKLKSKEKELKQQVEQKNDLQTQLRSSRDQVTEVGKEKLELTIIRRELEKKEIELINSKANWEKELKQYQKQIERMSEEIAELTSIASQNQTLEAEITALKKELELIQEENKFYKKRNVSVLREKDVLEEQLSQAKILSNAEDSKNPPSMKNLKERLKENKRKLIQMEDKEIHFREEIQEKERQIANLQASHRLAIQSLSSQNKDLNEKVQLQEKLIQRFQQEAKVSSERGRI
eukprot:TRINITY_DN1197_c0_g4_i1.p1 TRINITY_DN1197_c0_g4~~TRINITY_DN1197_c0_g4_i1.p1  ORF type:complete len:499 (-),score=141.69 TRINITY_DN1197_c0_g4_i1:83-1579(-)